MHYVFTTQTQVSFPHPFSPVYPLLTCPTYPPFPSGNPHSVVCVWVTLLTAGAFSRDLEGKRREYDWAGCSLLQNFITWVWDFLFINDLLLCFAPVTPLPTLGLPVVRNHIWENILLLFLFIDHELGFLWASTVASPLLVLATVFCDLTFFSLVKYPLIFSL